MVEQGTDRLVQRRSGRRFRIFGIVVFFVVLLAGTWGLRQWQVARIAASPAVYQEEVVLEALGFAERAFEAMQRSHQAQALAWAADNDLVNALRTHSRGDREASTEQLIHIVSGFELPERWAVEVYDTTPALVAWNGYSMPLDVAPTSPFFLNAVQTTLAEDEDWRKALAVWVPVRDGVRTVGILRVMQLLEVRTPVQNQYLRDYTIARVWRDETGLPIRVAFGDTFKATVSEQERWLQGSNGTVLGRVFIEPPSVDSLVREVGLAYDDVLAFWGVLLLCWIMGWIWSTYRRYADARTSQRELPAVLLRFGGVGIAWWSLRFALIALDIPARWQRGKAPLSPLFDPTHLASTIGGGLFRSTGDLLITVLFALCFALAFVDLAARFREKGATLYSLRRQLRERHTDHGAPLRFFATLLVGTLIAFGLAFVLTVLARHAILDSTLDYFARQGLMPKPLISVIFCTLILATIATIVTTVGLAWIVLWMQLRQWPMRWSGWQVAVGVIATIAGALGILYGVFDLQRMMPWLTATAFVVVGIGVASAGFRYRENSVSLLTLRSVLPTIFLCSVLLYPMFYSGMDAQRRIRMMDAMDAFTEGTDPRVLFAMGQLLEEAKDVSEVPSRLALPGGTGRHRSYLDSLSTVLLRGSLLTSLGPYDVSLSFLDESGHLIGRYDADQTLSRAARDESDAIEFSILRQMYAESGSEGAMVEQVTGRRDPDRHQYEGIAPIDKNGQRVGWVMARAEPQTLLQDASTPFPRVLLPAGFFGSLSSTLSLAEFRDGLLVRSFGRDFGRYRLDEAIEQALLRADAQWHSEAIKDKRFLTYYQRQNISPPAIPAIMAPTAAPIIAVRIPAITVFDHLYYLLRLTVAGLFVGVPLYLLGLWLRRRAGLLPAPRIRFRDKVLNAFLGVGIVAVGAVGFIGVQVVTGENERAVQSWLRDHLQSVEESLALEARGEEMPYRVLDRVLDRRRLDSLAARVGLDLNVYDGPHLIASSRPQFVREHLIDRRLPIEAYDALYHEGYQFTFAEEQLGSFIYTAGYYALPDEQGLPRYIVSVPTLPEQERIEEERARTLAYLFGALLILVLVVMLTAAVLANALARPIARLRVGLEDVAKGHFERKLPVGTRDEIGELVQTFNEMQEQLAESRRRLAQQERQLAWREMARQVAHEIKNPLTPMKLSVQHLRRAYDDGNMSGNGALQTGRFARMFERVTGTLIEQIDTLARIANEFSSFARMPKRVLERLDLNAVIEEAVALMQAEANAEIELQLHPEPLVLEADREELRRVYINLIKNALQAVPQDKEGRVTVVSERHEETAYTTVIDNGTGIPVDLRDKIFEPNFSTKTSGTGLGLAIVEKSITELNGHVGFETEEGGGTTFWIRLPIVE